MKTIIENWKRIGFVATIIALACPSCASSGGPPPLLQATTNQVQTVTQTNKVIVTETQTVIFTNNVVQTNVVMQTNLVPVQVTNIQNVVTYTPSGTVQTILGTAQAANTLTGPLDPFSGAITAVLGLFGAGMTWYARAKTQQVNTHASTIQTVMTAVSTLEPAAQAAFHAAVTGQANKAGAASVLTNIAQATTQSLGS